MITFENIPYTTEPTYFFLPAQLSGEFTPKLKAAGIEFQSYGRKKVIQNEVPNMPKLKTEDLQKFKDAGFEETLDTQMMAVIVSHVDTNYLFEKCCLLFGKNMDVDYKNEKAKYKALADAHYKNNKNWL